jgi:hypothetical protein
MAQLTRVYAVRVIPTPEQEGGRGEIVALVRAPSPARALAHYARNILEADVATQDDLITALSELGLYVSTAVEAPAQGELEVAP